MLIQLPTQAEVGMIQTECSVCGKSYKLKDEYAGKMAKCACGTQFIVADSTRPSPGVRSQPQCVAPVESALINQSSESGIAQEKRTSESDRSRKPMLLAGIVGVALLASAAIIVFVFSRPEKSVAQTVESPPKAQVEIQPVAPAVSAQPEVKPIVPEPVPSKPTFATDPVGDFKRYAAGYVYFAKDVSQLPKDGNAERWTLKENEKFSINVERTNSLVTPYLGTIVMKISYFNPAKSFAVNDADVVITFAGQDGKWVYKSTSATYLFTGQRLGCSDIMAVFTELVANRMPPSAIDMAEQAGQ